LIVQARFRPETWLVVPEDNMKTFHTVTAVIEIGAGLLLAAMPALAVTFLFGASLTTPVERALTQMAGVALLALGVACWLARADAQSRAARGLTGGMLVYNAGVATVLVYAALGLGLFGVGLWPAVLLHAALAIWCVLRLWRR
jgi:hypothetical protein